jgi:NAD(P)-dependent dehydrogenase (short-subunit alcohol dehydrogenase family)
MSLYSFLKPKGPNGFGNGSTAEDVTAGLSLSGKTILVTGCNSGLGLETMRVLALRGAHVLGAARSEASAAAACASVAGKASGVTCELSDPASVRSCVDAVKKKDGKLDAIICNAGIMALPKLKQAHGYELQFFTNHIGHFMLVTGLLDQLADDGKVVMLSSAGHLAAPKGGIEFNNLSGEKSYRPWSAYGQSKFANILFAKELARRMEGSRKTANAVHPGVIRTDLSRNMGLPAIAEQIGFGLGSILLFKSIPQGAATSCYVAANPGAASISGAYFADCNVKRSRPDSNDPALARKLWDVSEKIVAGLA